MENVTALTISEIKMSYSLKDIFGVSRLSSCVYIIRNKKQIIYVGRSEKQSVQSRLSKHLESYFSSQKPSHLSILLHKNNPQAFDWRVETLSIRRAEVLTGNKFDCLKCAEKGIYDFYSQKNRIPEGNKTRPNGCKKKYMIKGAHRILPEDTDSVLSKVENSGFISTISGAFCYSEKLNKRFGTNIEGYDCMKTSKYRCDFCSKHLVIGDEAHYVIDCSDRHISSLVKHNMYCSVRCLRNHFKFPS